MRRSLVVATSLLVLVAPGCASTGSPEAGYARSREDAEPLGDARTACRDDAKFRDGRGREWVDWQAFETCMNARGWARP